LLSHPKSFCESIREQSRKRAVHLPGHPENPLFLDILQQVGRMPEADLGNLLQRGDEE
jgi:hypothetical protein